MRISCPVCENENEAKLEVIQKEQEVTIRNEPIKIQINIRKCNNCGEEFIIPDVDEDPLEKAYREYRINHHFLLPEEIRSFRDKYHLTQGELAKLLGLGGATISRYENGMLQDETHDTLIKLAMNCENLRKLVIKSEGVFSEQKKEIILKAIDDDTEQMTECLREFITVNLENIKIDEFRGFRSFDMAKFTNAVLYFCKEGVVKTKLNKLLFYADFLNFKDYVISITGAQYARVPFGPAPNNFDLYYSVLYRQGFIDIEEIDYHDYTGEEYRAACDPDLSVFSDGELRILSTVNEFFKAYKAVDISNRSHQEKGYKETNTGKLISYSYAQDISL